MPTSVDALTLGSHFLTCKQQAPEIDQTISLSSKKKKLMDKLTRPKQPQVNIRIKNKHKNKSNLTNHIIIRGTGG